MKKVSKNLKRLLKSALISIVSLSFSLSAVIPDLSESTSSRSRYVSINVHEVLKDPEQLDHLRQSGITHLQLKWSKYGHTFNPTERDHIQLKKARQLKQLFEFGWSGLLYLDLSDPSTGIGLPGVNALAECPSLGDLQSLNLNGNDIRNAGAHTIATNPTFSNLKELILRGNWIDEDGIHVFMKTETLSKLEKLDLASNNIRNGEDIKMEIRHNLPKIQSLVLN